MSIDLLKVFWSRKREIFLFAFIATVTTFIISFFLPKQYEAKSFVLITNPIIRATTDMGSLSTESYKQLATTPGILQKVVDALKPKKHTSEHLLHPEILSEMIKIDTKGTTKKRTVPETAPFILELKVKGPDSLLITEVANTLTNLWIKECRKIQSNIASVNRDRSIKPIKPMKNNNNRLASLNAALNKYNNNRLASLNAALNKNNNRLASLNAALFATNRDLVLVKSKVASLQKQLKEGSQEVIVSRSVAVIKPFKLEYLLKADLSEQLTVLDVLIASKIFQNESIEKIKQENTPLNTRIEKIEQENMELNTRIENLSKIDLDASKNNLDSTSHDLDIQHKMEEIRILSKAIEPNIPIWPNKAKMSLIAFIISFIVGLTVALSKEHWDQVK